MLSGMAEGLHARTGINVRSYKETSIRTTPRRGGVARTFSLLPRRVERVDFIVAGVQKAGTTALHYFLAKHPHIALPRDQALHFFDQAKNFQGEADYETLHGNFDRGWRWRIAGEVTADYVYYTPALSRIANYNPAMKLIISLRNPTERAFSHWNMRRAKGREPLDFLDAIKLDQAQIGTGDLRGNAHIERGLYTPQLERVFEIFPRDQVLLIKYEEFREDYSKTLEKVFDFLGIDRLPHLKNAEQNAGPYQRKMTAEEREEVSAIFSEDISRLEQMLGWDCSDWRGKSVPAL
jgi:hypothetical protein